MTKIPQAIAELNAALLPRNETTEIQVSWLLTKTQLRASELDGKLNVSQNSLAPVRGLTHELDHLEKQAYSVAEELQMSVKEIVTVARSSEDVSAKLREGLALYRRYLSLAATFNQTKHVISLLGFAEASVKNGEVATAMKTVVEILTRQRALHDCASNLQPAQMARITALTSCLHDRLQEQFLPALRNRDMPTGMSLVKQFHALGLSQSARALYLTFQVSRLSEAIAEALQHCSASRDLLSIWSIIEDTIRSEYEVVSGIFPGDEHLLSEVVLRTLDARNAEIGQALLQALEGAFASSETVELNLLEECWERARRSSANLQDVLAWSNVEITEAVQTALFLPFEATQLQISSILCLHAKKLFPNFRAHGDAAAKPFPISALATQIEHSRVLIAEHLVLSVRRCLIFSGAVGIEPMIASLSSFFESFHESIRTAAQASLQSFADESCLPKPTDGVYECCSFLRAINKFQVVIVAFESELCRICVQEARVTAGFTPRQKEAAGALLERMGGEANLLALREELLSEVLLLAQRLVHTCLLKEITSTLAQVGSSTLLDVWMQEGCDASEGSCVLSEPPPSSYITQVGECMLGLPQQLDAFAGDGTLSGLHVQLRAPSRLHVSEDVNWVVEWYHSIAHASVLLFLKAVRGIPALSLNGARQLASDVAYLANVLHAGLGLPPSQELGEVQSLLDGDSTELDSPVLNAVRPGLANEIIHKLRKGGR